ERVFTLAEKMQANNARTQLNAALDSFQAQCPIIEHDQKNTIVSATKGTKIEWMSASIESIVKQIKPMLRENGLIFYWDAEEVSGNKIQVTCVLRHAAGDQISARYVATADTSGPLGAQNAQAAAHARARRYSLMNVLGIVTADGKAPEGDLKIITDHQAA